MLENFQLNNDDRFSDQSVQCSIGKLEINIDRLDMNNKELGLESVVLKDSRLLYVQSDTQDQSIKETGAAIKLTNENQLSDGPDWKIRLEKLALKNSEVSYHDYNHQPQPQGMDSRHLEIEQINSVIKQIRIEEFKFGTSRTNLKSACLKISKYNDIFTDEINILGNGAISGWESIYTLHTDSFHLFVMTENAAFASFLPVDIKSENLDMPPDISLDLNLNGSLESLAGGILIQSNWGGLSCLVSPGTGTKENAIHFISVLEIENIQLGHFPGDPDLGTLDAKLELNGQGNDPDNLVYHVKGLIKNIDYAGFVYQDLILDAEYDDPDLYFNLSGKQPAYSEYCRWLC